MSLLGGHRPQPHRGTLTPLVPLSLRAYKGEWEIRIEAHVRALHARGPLIQYWGEWGWIPVLGGRDRGVEWGRKLTGLVGCQRGGGPHREGGRRSGVVLIKYA